jgi:hypothetical protein
MSTNAMPNATSLEADREPVASAHFGFVRRAARGAVVAGAIAGLSLTALPTTARAGGPGVGAAIGLGILGGVIAGAAIAATAPPVYAAPSPYYYYPNGGYAPASGYYSAPQAYYGPAPAGYPQPSYGYYYSR